MHRTLCRSIALSLFVVTLSPCAPAQEELPEETHYVWTGRVQRDGEWVPLAGEFAPQEELARIELSLEVERDFAGALEALGDLRIRAARAGAQDLETLVQVARMRGELLLRVGRVAEARAALEHLLPGEPARARSGEYELKPAADEEWQAVVLRRLDPRLVELRERIAAQTSDSGSPAGIEKAVREAFAIGRPSVALDIGPRAAPALERLLLESPDSFPGVESDPLAMLLELSELRGAAVIAAHWDAGGFFWKKRIVRAMEHADVLTNDGTWQETHDDQVAPRLLETGWLPILARLVHDPEVGRDAVGLVEIVAFNDALSPELQTGLQLALRSPDPDLVREVLRALENTHGKPSIESVVAAALDHPDGEIRRFACEHLLSFEPARALLGAADHEDPLVRGFVARALCRRSVREAFYDRDVYAHSDTIFQRRSIYQTVTPVLGEREREVLSQLAGDADASVRLEAVRSLARAPGDSVGEALWRRLAGDEDAAVRAASVDFERSDARVEAAVLVELAADADPAVLRAVDSRLHRLIASFAKRDRHEAGRRLEPYLEVLAVRRANRVLSMAPSEWGGPRDIYTAAVQSDAGIARVAEWGLADEDDDLIALLVDQAPWRARDSWGSNVGLGCLDDERFAAVYAHAFRISRATFEEVLRGTNELQPSRAPAVRRILVDAGHPRALRVQAAWSAAPAGGAEYREQLLALLREGSWTERGPEATELGRLRELVRRLPESERTGLLRAVVGDAAVPDEIGLHLFHETARREGFDSGVAAEVVSRWYESGEDVTVIDTALLHLQAEPGERLSAVLVEAARHPDYYASAIATLGRLGHPEYLETLGACLRPVWFQEEDRRSYAQHCAVQALGGYMNADAARYLLEGLSSIRDDEVREECFVALEAIRRYQEERELWDAREARERARSQVVQELLAMLGVDDSHQRVQAVRSLAALGAVEHLTTMARLLADEDYDVREAARAALEVLGRERPEPEQP